MKDETLRELVELEKKFANQVKHMKQPSKRKGFWTDAEDNKRELTRIAGELQRLADKVGEEGD